MTGTSDSRTQGRGRMVAPLVVGAATFMQAFDSSAIIVALPAMARDFGVPVLSLNLVVVAYLVAATAALPACGWAADRFGARRIFLIAVAGFGLTSLAAMLAPGFGWLIAARIVQGCMGALLLPVGRIIVLRSVPRHDYVSALAMLSLPIMLGPLLGPTLGGLVVTAGSWRWLFAINIIVSIVGLFTVRHFVEDLPGDDPRPLDLIGLTLIAAALVGISSGITAFDPNGPVSAMPALLLLGGVMCALLYGWHGRRHPQPLLDLRILRTPVMAAANLGGLFQRMLVGAAPFLLTMLFQPGLGLDAATSGTLIFASAFGAILGRWFLPPLIARFGFRTFLIGNSLVMALSMAVCALIDGDTPYAVIVIILFLQGLIRAVQLMGLLTLSYAGLPDKDMGSASTLASISQQFAIAPGIALSVAALQIMQHWRGASVLSPAIVAPAFLVVAAMSLLSLFWYWRLPRDVGRELSESRVQAQLSTASEGEA